MLFLKNYILDSKFENAFNTKRAYIRCQLTVHAIDQKRLRTQIPPATEESQRYKDHS